MPPKVNKIQVFITRLSKKERTLFYCAILFVFIVVLDRLLIHPISSKLIFIDKEIKDKQSGLKKDLRILSQAKRIAELKSKYSSYLNKSKTEDEEAISMLKEVESLAAKNLISLSDLKPAGSSKDGEFLKYFVNVNFEAPMEKVINFVYSIENSDKLLIVEKYQIVPKSKDTDLVQCVMSVSKVTIP